MQNCIGYRHCCDYIVSFSHKASFFPLLLLPDCYRLHLLMSHQKVCASGHVSRQQSLDVRVWPRDVRSHRVVRLDLLLPARLSRRRTPFCLRLGSRHQLHPVATGEAAVQPHVVLLGRLRPQRWPFLARPADDLLSTAASACLATLFRQQRLAGHEPDCACACPSGNQEPCVWLLGPTGHLLMRAANGYEFQPCVLNAANRFSGKKPEPGIFFLRRACSLSLCPSHYVLRFCFCVLKFATFVQFSVLNSI